MAHVDGAADLDPRYGLRDLLGLRGSTAWWFLLILEAVIALYMARNFGQAPLWAAAAALALMLSAGALVTAIPVDPLPIPGAGVWGGGPPRPPPPAPRPPRPPRPPPSGV
ncbi:hypothetical protein ACFXO7_23105, partial [Nocardia tengchongensis]